MKILTATVGLLFPFKPSTPKSHAPQTRFLPSLRLALRRRRLRLFLRFLPLPILNPQSKIP